jgi:2-phospho-L-lactate guanylyltransferase
MFDERHRARLVAGMAFHVLRVTRDSGIADQVVVVTRDDHLLESLDEALPEVYGVLQGPESVGMNAGIDTGRQAALWAGSERLLVLPADLPELEVSDLTALMDSDADVVIGPDTGHCGTNALLLNGREAISSFSFHFGIGSRKAHLRTGLELGLRVEDVIRPGLALDLDTPEDWAKLSEESQLRLLSPDVPGMAWLVPGHGSRPVLEHV